MAYLIELHTTNVEPYLDEAGPLSPAVRAILKRQLSDLAEHGDFFINDPHYRIPDSPYFCFDFIMRDPETGKLRGFYFVVSDEAAEFGVLRIVFVDEKA